MRGQIYVAALAGVVGADFTIWSGFSNVLDPASVGRVDGFWITEYMGNDGCAWYNHPFQTEPQPEGAAGVHCAGDPDACAALSPPITDPRGTNIDSITINDKVYPASPNAYYNFGPDSVTVITGTGGGSYSITHNGQPAGGCARKLDQPGQTCGINDGGQLILTCSSPLVPGQ